MTLAAPPMGVVPLGETSNVWLTRFQALSVGDEGEESYRIFYVGAESAGGLAPPTFFAGSGRSANNAVPGNGCTTTTSENCKILQYPSEVAATGSVSGNVITIDVPVQGGFGANRPILGTTLHNVTALSAGRGNLGTEIADIYADVDATKSFDFPLAGGGGPPPPPPPPRRRLQGHRRRVDLRRARRPGTLQPEPAREPERQGQVRRRSGCRLPLDSLDGGDLQLRRAQRDDSRVRA